MSLTQTNSTVEPFKGSFKKTDLVELKEVYEGGRRFYKTPKGEKYPSVTTMLSHFKKDVINEWRKKVGEEAANKIMRAAASRGTAVHNLLEKYLDNTEIPSNVITPFHKSLFMPIKQILDSHLSEVWVSERGLYSDHLRLAGRVDLIGKWKGEGHIIDFKTSTKQKKEEWIKDYFLQASAYALMFKERSGITISKFVILIVDEEGGLQQFEGKCSDYFKPLLELRKQYPF